MSFKIVCDLWSNQLLSTGIKGPLFQKLPKGYIPLYTGSCDEDSRLGEISIEMEEQVMRSLGILHLYRSKKEEADIICVVVPGYICLEALLQIVQVPYIQNVCVIRDYMERYFVAFKFESSERAMEFEEIVKSRISRDCKSMLVLKISSFLIQTTQVGPLVTYQQPEKILEVELPSCLKCLSRLDESASGIKDLDLSQDCFCYGYQSCFCEQNLWMCLVCKHLGCGRYAQGHAREHYTETNHRHALDVESKSIWDYETDKYVHRLDHECAETSLKNQIQKLTLKLSQLELESESSLKKQRRNEKQLQQTIRSLDEERVLTRALYEKVKKLNSDYKQKEQKCMDLQEQVRDLNFYVSTRDLVDTNLEIRNAKIVNKNL